MNRLIFTLALLWTLHSVCASQTVVLPRQSLDLKHQAKIAINQEKIEPCLALLKKLPYDSAIKIELLNFLFSKPQFVLDEAAKQQLSSELICIFEDRHLGSIRSMTQRLIVSKQWADYLVVQNPKIAEFFQWLSQEQKTINDIKQLAQKEQEKNGLSQICTFVNQAAPNHPYKTAFELEKILKSADCDASLPTVANLLNGEGQTGLNSEMRSAIYTIMYSDKPLATYKRRTLVTDENTAVAQTLRMTPRQTIARMLPRFEVQCAQVWNQLHEKLASTNKFPAPALCLIAGYAMSYRWGQSIAHTKPDVTEQIWSHEWNFDKQMIDNIDAIMSHPKIERCTDLSVKGHFMTSMPAHVWKNLTRLRRLNLSTGMLTDYPVEIEAIPTLLHLDLSRNPLTDEALKRYEAFQKVLEKRASHNKMHQKTSYF